MHYIRVLLFLIVLNCYVGARAQNVETDSLKKELAVENDQEKRVSILEGLSYGILILLLRIQRCNMHYKACSLHKT